MSTTLEDLARQAVSIKKTFDDLISRFETLNTFVEADRWDADAFAVVHLYERCREALNACRSYEQQAIQEEKKTRTAMPLMKRLFASRQGEEEHLKKIGQIDQRIASAGEAISQLLERIDRTPNSSTLQKEMLSDFRAQKMDLTTDKREVNEEMRLIHTKARQDSASLSGANAESARTKRMKIRQQEERALNPHEDARAAIERQLIDVERRINWVSRFAGVNPILEEKVLRCAYCGIRVMPGARCPACGSKSTTSDL
jgi:hypothetical protein